MKTSLQLREEIADLCNRVDAIVDVARAENRDLTAEETAEVDRIQGRGKPGDAGYTSGQVSALQADLDRVEKIEARQAQLAADRANGRTTGAAAATVQTGSPTADAAGPTDDEAILASAGGSLITPRVAKISIPVASRFRHSALKAYTGPKADERAFLAGMFFLATLGKSAKAARWCTDHGVDINIRDALAETSSEKGGYLVPLEMEQTIIELRQKYGVFRQRAKSTPMSSDTKSVPRRISGLAATFAGENSTVTPTDKQWDQVKLIAKKLMVITLYSTELSEDAIINIGDDLTDEIAYAFALKEDQCGFLGDGTSQYGGIVGLANALNSNSIYQAPAGHNSFGTLTLSDFEAVVGMLPEYPGIKPCWYIHKAGFAASMMHLIDAAGANTMGWMTLGPPGGYFREFLGYEVVISQVLNSNLGVDTNGVACFFGDLAMSALIGNRRGMTIQVSDDRYFEFDQIGVKGTQRFDINVHERGDTVNGTAGSIVMLKKAAS